MKTSGDKTKVFHSLENHSTQPSLEEVDSFSYLGCEQAARMEIDVRIRIEKAATVNQMWRWKVFMS